MRVLRVAAKLSGNKVLTDYVPGMGIFNLAKADSFFVFAILIAAVNYINKGKRTEEEGIRLRRLRDVFHAEAPEKKNKKGAEEAC